jgi:hypothetical protein
MEETFYSNIQNAELIQDGVRFQTKTTLKFETQKIRIDQVSQIIFSTFHFTARQIPHPCFPNQHT